MSAPRVVSAIVRARVHVAARRRARAFAGRLPLTPRDDIVTIGDLAYGGYAVPERLLRPDGVRYLVGAGTDISFDVLLLAAYGGAVHTFDPVPGAADYVARAARHEPRLRFHPVALWSEDRTLTFHAPRRTGFVSHSAVNMHHTPVAFTAQARSVSSMMRELGHDRIELLKISAEGAEHEILDHMLNDGLAVDIVCVELAQPASLQRSMDGVEVLVSRGWRLVAASVRPFNWKLTFVAPHTA